MYKFTIFVENKNGDIMNKYFNLAEKINDKVLKHYYTLHQYPEIGFDLPITYKYVFDELTNLGYKPISCGKCGLYVDIGNTKESIVLLRADMDALPILEDTNLSFKAANGKMHACGHDMHTAMLLGCAELLKNFQFDGCIRLMFQPAEEIISGAKSMISNGVLKNVTNALMIHVMPNTTLDTGTLVIPECGIITPACDNFQIRLLGKSAHGGFPYLGIDIFTVSALITLGLKNIKVNEITLDEKIVLSLGEISAGNTYNVIPDTLTMKGMLRTFNTDLRKFVLFRIEEIVRNICKAYHIKYKFIIDQSVCSFINDKNLRNNIINICNDKNLPHILTPTSSSGGSEDFSEVSKFMPTNMLMLCAGKKSDGYCYDIHHPKTIFDLETLKYGVAYYTLFAIELLKLNNLKK